MVFSAIILLLVLYIIWDVNYFLRCVFTVGLSRFLQKKVKITETTTIDGIKIVTLNLL